MVFELRSGSLYFASLFCAASFWRIFLKNFMLDIINNREAKFMSDLQNRTVQVKSTLC